MIRINKHSKLSLSIEFDEEGAKALLSTLQETISMQTAIIQVDNELKGSTIQLEFIQDEDMDSKYFYPAEVCDCTQDKEGKEISVYAQFIKK